MNFVNDNKKCYFEGEPKDGNYKKYKLKYCEILKYSNENYSVNDSSK